MTAVGVFFSLFFRGNYCTKPRVRRKYENAFMIHFNICLTIWDIYQTMQVWRERFSVGATAVGKDPRERHPSAFEIRPRADKEEHWFKVLLLQHWSRSLGQPMVKYVSVVTGHSPWRANSICTTLLPVKKEKKRERPRRRSNVPPRSKGFPPPPILSHCCCNNVHWTPAPERWWKASCCCAALFLHQLLHKATIHFPFSQIRLI